MDGDQPSTRGPEPLRFGRFRLPLATRTLAVVAVVALLAVGAGSVVLGAVTSAMSRDADARLDRFAQQQASTLADLMDSASRDIRLARRNVVFETALEHTKGQLLPADRAAVEQAITYLGERYQVDEICVIRSSGLEAARWVTGNGLAAVADLSPDERSNNPAVLPTLKLADDDAYQTQPYVSPDSKRWVIGVATPIVLPSGEHAGILHFEIPIARFVSVLGTTSFSTGSFAMLLDRSGHLLVHPDLAQIRTAESLSTDPNTGPFPIADATGSASWRGAVDGMRDGSAGTATYDDGTRAYRVSYLPVADSNRILAVAVPVDELYADANRAMFNLVITAGPLLVLIVIVSAWFARRMATANRRMAGVNARLALTNERLEESNRASHELANESAILNQFTELTALTEDDVSLSVATLATLDELLHPGDAALHVSNPSQDRAVPQATLGGREAQVLALHDLAACPAQRRSSLYVTTDVTKRLSFRCPVYPVERGTLACVPLVALGETVGAIHLHWDEVRELSLPVRLSITRVSEHAALSIANRRLLLALRGQASTDGRTGLTNSRAFDEAVERVLVNRGSRESLAILMLDLDRFKDFNDRYGHPAGDEALRAFAHILRSCVRDEDLVARYGGEEFAVCLPGASPSVAVEVAERIRERTESTIIPIGPGKTGRLTVSIGIAAAPQHGTERVALLKSADEALYRAKLAGRNRVVIQPGAIAPDVSEAGNGSGNGHANGQAAGANGTTIIRRRTARTAG